MIGFSILKGVYKTDSDGKRHLLRMWVVSLQLLLCCAAFWIRPYLFPDMDGTAAFFLELAFLIALYLLTSGLLYLLAKAGANWLFEKKACK